ncbi:MAG TPA: efflux RND transporter periplasmic adaptor subunit [Thermoanaerobaculia bacterium]|jgi:RND family efflux transporter MFP subunit
MKRIAGVLVAALAATTCAKQEESRVPAAERTLATIAVESQVLPSRIEVDGVVVGRFETVLSSRLTAPVAEVRAVPGETVRAGTILVRLEEHEAEGALEGARASVDAARAALLLAKKNRVRFEKLEQRGAAAAVELDRATQEEASATAAVASARALLRRAETDRAQAVLTAPFDAVVVERMVSPGDLAAPGRPLVRLASLVGRRVEAAPGEQEAAALAPGDELEVVVGGRSFQGRVAEIVGAINPSTRRRIVRVDLPAGFEPSVGSFARLILPGPAAPRLLIPERAVVARGGLEIVWAVGTDRRVALRYVRTGLRHGGSVEIRSGLKAGERVVLDPPPDLEADTRVAS